MVTKRLIISIRQYAVYTTVIFGLITVVRLNQFAQEQNVTNPASRNIIPGPRARHLHQDTEYSANNIDAAVETSLDRAQTRTDSDNDSDRLQTSVFIAVKTTQKYHKTRLRWILDTWFELAPNSTFFFTDDDDNNLNLETGGHLIKTGCNAGHHRSALCCKMNAELEFYYQQHSNKSWFCHFDDDNYVNVPELARTLSKYDPTQAWYLGKSSTGRRIKVLDRAATVNWSEESSAARQKHMVEFWFATGGAGICLSQTLLQRIRPYFEHGKFELLGNILRLPDDVSLGYVIERLAHVNLTQINALHSHLEGLYRYKAYDISRQISLSYQLGVRNNVVDLPGPFTPNDDPTRFYSIHCWLFRKSPACQRKKVIARKIRKPTVSL